MIFLWQVNILIWQVDIISFLHMSHGFEDNILWYFNLPLQKCNSMSIFTTLHHPFPSNIKEMENYFHLKHILIRDVIYVFYAGSAIFRRYNGGRSS